MNLELNVCTPAASGRAPSPGQAQVDFDAIKQRAIAQPTQSLNKESHFESNPGQHRCGRQAGA